MLEAEISALAHQDILDIWENIAVDDINAADRVRRSLFRIFELLAANPELGPRRKWVNPRLKSVRFFPLPDFPKYLIFYRPLEPRSVEIVRVLHGAQNVVAILEES